MKALMPLPLSALTLRMDQLREIPDAKGKTEDARLREASNEFEAIFIQQMLKQCARHHWNLILLKSLKVKKYFDQCWMNNTLFFRLNLGDWVLVR